jgi:hypothetical protein
MRKHIITVAILHLLVFVSLCGEANAIPPVIAANSARAFVINIGFGGFLDPGWYLILRASITPSGQSTTAFAQQDSSDSYPLAFSPQPFPAQANRYQSTTLYAGEKGQWTITASNAGDKATAMTNPLDDPQLLPLATNFSVSGELLTPTLTWDSFADKGYSSFSSVPCPEIGYDYYMLTVTIRLAQPGMPLLYSSSSFYTTVTSYKIDPTVFALSENEEYIFSVVLSQSDLHQCGNPQAVPPILPIVYTESMSETYLYYSTKPAPKTVAIDINPGKHHESIDFNNYGEIIVAILSTSEFDASSILDKDSLTFGRTGDEDSLAFCYHRPEDTNRDGLKDLVCHFYSEDTGFQRRDREGILKGTTKDGVSIQGSDSVKIYPCKKPCRR